MIFCHNNLTHILEKNLLPHKPIDGNQLLIFDMKNISRGCVARR